MVSLAASITFTVLLFFFSISISIAHPLSTIIRPTVLLVSTDGFRFDYLRRTSRIPTPNIDRLIAEGTVAKDGLIPVFPTLTFPNHYSIVTGLYPAYHGIVMNKFTDPTTQKTFTLSNTDPQMWLGEPLWETVVRNGFNASTYFWPGSEVQRVNWTCPSEFCPSFNLKVPFEERVDTILGYFKLPSEEIPAFMTLYLQEPDAQGHKFGPDSEQVTEAITRVDKMIGRLIQGLEAEKVFEDVTIILVGDHGMIGTNNKDTVSLEGLVESSWVQSYGTVLAIQPPESVDAPKLVANMNEALTSGKVENGMKLKVYLKEDLPEHLHYNESGRILRIIGLLEEGFAAKDPKREVRAGEHGYDNNFSSMRSIFIGRGPMFERDRKVESFENVEIYNIITSILNIKDGAPNNGTVSFPCKILKPGSCTY